MICVSVGCEIQSNFNCLEGYRPSRGVPEVDAEFLQGYIHDTDKQGPVASISTTPGAIKRAYEIFYTLRTRNILSYF